MKTKTIGGVVAFIAAVGLTLGGATVAFADDTPAPVVTDQATNPDVTDPAPVDPPADPAPVVVAPDAVQADVAAPAEYRTVAWAMPSWVNSTTPTWPQTLAFESDATTAPSLDALDGSLTACGSQWQVDIYNDNATTTALVAGGHLDGPGNPAESLVPGGWGTAYKLVQTAACPPDYPKPVACDSVTTLDTVTATTAESLGWGDVKNATFTANGAQITATASDEGYIYRDFPAVPFTHMGDLSFVADGDAGVIIQESNGDSIHYDADGRYWSVHPGLFPETAPGFYSTYHPEQDGQLLSNPDVTEYAIWVNPGRSALVHSVNYACQTQSFAGDAVVTPPTTVSSVTPTAQLAETGVDQATAAGMLGIAALLLVGGASLGIVAWRRRIQ